MKKAFTLAEVLITLGIIGVVAAITIPALIQKYTDIRNSAMLKEDYSILQQMMKSAVDEGASVSASGYTLENLKNYFNTYFLPYVKILSVCYDEEGCWSEGYKSLSGTIFSYTGCGVETISFVLYNGSYVCMDDFADGRFGVETSSATVGFLVDVNGAGKPNTFGKDIFALTLKDEELLPGGYDMTDDEVDKNCSVSKCSGKWCGIYCLVKAQKQGFKLPVVAD